jgi:hypothetical protein
VSGIGLFNEGSYPITFRESGTICDTKHKLNTEIIAKDRKNLRIGYFQTRDEIMNDAGLDSTITAC